MSKPVFPPDLKAGDVIRVVSPAGPAEPERLKRGIRRLESWGYEVSIGRHTLSRSGFLAGNDIDRAEDLIEAFKEPSVDAVFCSRGGYGAQRLFPLIPWDELSELPVKAFIGFSDISALQLVMWDRSDWVSYSGPQVAMGMSGDVSEASLEHLRYMVEGSSRKIILPGKNREKLKPVISGSAEGKLIPCCLSMLVSMIGTEYFPDLSGTILCIEDIGEAPYRIDRMLLQLKYAGVLDNINALVLGSFIWNEQNIVQQAAQSAVELFGNYDFAIWQGLAYGHIRDRLTLPVGCMSKIDNAGFFEIV